MLKLFRIRSNSTIPDSRALVAVYLILGILYESYAFRGLVVKVAYFSLIVVSILLIVHP
jgi:hypothetical protein